MNHIKNIITFDISFSSMMMMMMIFVTTTLIKFQTIYSKNHLNKLILKIFCVISTNATIFTICKRTGDSKDAS